MENFKFVNKNSFSNFWLLKRFSIFPVYCMWLYLILWKAVRLPEYETAFGTDNTLTVYSFIKLRLCKSSFFAVCSLKRSLLSWNCSLTRGIPHWQPPYHTMAIQHTYTRTSRSARKRHASFMRSKQIARLVRSKYDHVLKRHSQCIT